MVKTMYSQLGWPGMWFMPGDPGCNSVKMYISCWWCVVKAASQKLFDKMFHEITLSTSKPSNGRAHENLRHCLVQDTCKLEGTKQSTYLSQGQQLPKLCRHLFSTTFTMGMPLTWLRIANTIHSERVLLTAECPCSPRILWHFNHIR